MFLEATNHRVTGNIITYENRFNETKKCQGETNKKSGETKIYTHGSMTR